MSATADDRAIAGEDSVWRFGVEIGGEASGDDAAVDGREIGLNAAAAEGVVDLAAGVEALALEHDRRKSRQKCEEGFRCQDPY